MSTHKLRGFADLAKALAEKPAHTYTAPPPPSDHASEPRYRLQLTLSEDEVDLDALAARAADIRRDWAEAHVDQLHPDQGGIYPWPEPKDINQPVRPPRIMRQQPRKRAPRFDGMKGGSWVPNRDDNRHNPVPSKGRFE